jgi:hypothetical protein
MSFFSKHTLLVPFFFLAIVLPCYSQIESRLKIDRNDFQKLMSETGLKEMNSPRGSMLIDYKHDILTIGSWKGQIQGIYFGYSDLELRITQTEPIIKGTWKTTLPGGADVPLDDSLVGEIVGKNDSGKIRLILIDSTSDSTYYLEYLSGNCFTWDPGYQHNMHKHYFFGIAENYPTFEYGYPGSYFFFRKDDWTPGKK